MTYQKKFVENRTFLLAVKPYLLAIPRTEDDPDFVMRYHPLEISKVREAWYNYFQHHAPGSYRIKRQANTLRIQLIRLRNFVAKPLEKDILAEWDGEEGEEGEEENG